VLAWGPFVFGPWFWGGQPSPPVTSCPAGSELTYSSDGVNFSPNIPFIPYAFPGSPTTITTRCECGNNVSPVSMVTNTPAPFCFFFRLRFSDPCDCTNPLNCNVDGVQYNHDFLTIEADPSDPMAAALPSGLNITLASASDFTAGVPCDGGGLEEHVAGNTFIETSPGIYELEFWKADNGNLPNVSISVEGGPAVEVPASTFDSHLDCGCEEALADATIPTMSEWGLFLFGLLVLNMSLIVMRRNELAVF